MKNQILNGESTLQTQTVYWFFNNRERLEALENIITKLKKELKND